MFWVELYSEELCDDVGIIHVPHQALHSALHTFDMMESVLVRIEELTEVKSSI